jgi:phage baseplate assembly protein W
MPIYVGYNSQKLYQDRNIQSVGSGYGTGNLVAGFQQPKKYTTVDEQLVIQDLSNALNIKQGDLPGNPSYGTTIWSYVFEPSSSTTVNNIQDEIKRVASQDPRVLLNTVNAYVQENGILIQIEMSVNLFNNALQVGFFLNRTTGTATQV